MGAEGAWGVVAAVAIFLGSGVCEIGGGWLVWKWRRDGWNLAFFFLGCLALIAYGILPTLQDNSFGRTYAAYGGFFIVLALLWGWAFDGMRPDLWDGIGAALGVAGACLMFFMPRPEALPPPGLAPPPSPAALSTYPLMPRTPMPPPYAPSPALAAAPAAAAGGAVAASGASEAVGALNGVSGQSPPRPLGPQAFANGGPAAPDQSAPSVPPLLPGPHPSPAAGQNGSPSAKEGDPIPFG